MTTYGTHDGATGSQTGDAATPSTVGAGGGDMLSSLDVLAEKVEMARATIVKLREDNEELRVQCDSLRSALSRYEATGTPEQVETTRGEINELAHERDALLAERNDVAERVRAILTKVETLEGLS